MDRVDRDVAELGRVAVLGRVPAELGLVLELGLVDSELGREPGRVDPELTEVRLNFGESRGSLSQVLCNGRGGLNDWDSSKRREVVALTAPEGDTILRTISWC